MKSHNRSVFWKFGVLALIVMIVYNVFATSIGQSEAIPVKLWCVSPFILLLLSMAIAPFINRLWWGKNYPLVAYSLGFIVIFYYGFFLHDTPRLFLTSYEYISFISLIGSLFVVSGGIHIRIRGKSTPLGNVAILTTGAIVSNILGTTGASMLLIRPYLWINRHRIKGYHVVFFIFIVSNIGGALTPIGAPPLFLGFLNGIPFFWITARVSQIWIIVMILLLFVFFLVDFYSFKKTPVHLRKARQIDEPEVSGLHNIIFLIIILAAVFIEPPAPLIVREVVMWCAALASFLTTKREIHEKNDFNFAPMKEVAILFAGIFATMIPALDWLKLNGAYIGVVTPGQFFWGSGILSSVLDNVPAYLGFLRSAFNIHGANIDNLQHMNVMLGITTPVAMGLSNPLQIGALEITTQTWRYVQAISVGSVFFGAVTYIGNSPNFMVKSLAEQLGVECPSFFGYIVRYSLPILIPIFVLIWYIYFRL